MNKEKIDNEHLDSLEVFMKHHYIADNGHYQWVKKRFKELQQENKQLEKEVERLKEREKLVTEHYDVMVRHAGNLEGKIIQLETNRDNAIRFIKKCSFIEQHKEDVIEILERGKQ